MKDKPSRVETESKINIRAWKDPAFKKKLLSDPRSTLKEFGLKNIPDNLKIRIIEEKPNEWDIVLHQIPPNAKNLSEEELKNFYAAYACKPVSSACH